MNIYNWKRTLKFQAFSGPIKLLWQLPEVLKQAAQTSILVVQMATFVDLRKEIVRILPGVAQGILATPKSLQKNVESVSAPSAPCFEIVATKLLNSDRGSAMCGNARTFEKSAAVC